MNPRSIIFLSLLLLVFLSCDKWVLEQKDFIQVEISPPDSLAIDSIFISGRLKDLEIGQIKDHGFVWTTLDDGPDYYFKEGIKPLGIKTKTDPEGFSATLKLEPRKRYTIKAYATLDEKEYVYSDPIEYNTGIAAVSTLELNYKQGSSLDVSGRLSGTEKGFFAVEHGFCWSTTNANPDLKNNDDIVKLGNRRNNEVFTWTFNGLQDDIKYYFRAYAVITLSLTKDTTVYGQIQFFDEKLVFWSEAGEFMGGKRKNAVGFSIGSMGYVGTGWNDTGVKEDFWRYDLQTGVWTQLKPFPGGPRKGAVGFSIGEKGYMGMGEDQNGDIQNDFWEYNPLVNEWNSIPALPVAKAGRTGSIGFSIGQKGYIGTGKGTDGTLKKDFWEFDPTAANPWSEKRLFGGDERMGAVGFSIGQKGFVGTGGADIPGIEKRADLKEDFWEYDPSLDEWIQKANFPGGGRIEAVGFSIAQKGYIGTGQLDDADLKNDCWEFDPEDASDGVDSKGNPLGRWKQIKDIEGEPRSGAVGFSIGQRGFIGTGGTEEGGSDDFEDDFLEFEPEEVLPKKADFRGGGRTGAVGFSIGQKGYVGLGEDAQFDARQDFWEYDLLTNTWTQKVDYPGGPTSRAVGFVINGKGYVGMGLDYDTEYDAKIDFWEYDPQTNTWTEKASYPGGLREELVSFAIDQKGYVGLGIVDPYILTGGDDLKTRFWDRQGNVIHNFEGHAETIYAAITSPNRQYVLTGSKDRTAKLWDLQGNLIRTFQGHLSPVKSLAFSPDGKYILTGGDDNVAKLWSLQEGVWIKDFPSNAGDVLSVDFFYTEVEELIMMGNRGGTVQLWDIQRDSLILNIDVPVVQSLHSAVWSRNGQRILTGSDDGVTRLWDLQGNLVRSFIESPDSTAIRSVAFFDNGNILTGNDAGMVRLWDQEGNLVLKHQAHSGIIRSVDPAGEFFLTGGDDEVVKLWDLQGELKQSFENHTGKVFSVTFVNVDEIYATDFRSYDPITDQWITSTPFPDVGRASAVGFSIDQKGYIGMGVNQFDELLNDFWEYDPITNEWSRRANFGGGNRGFALGFSIEIEQGFWLGLVGLGIGSDGLKKDIWVYDQGQNSWSRNTDFEGGARGLSIGFSIGDKGYIGLGVDENDNTFSDFLEYDP